MKENENTQQNIWQTQVVVCDRHFNNSSNTMDCHVFVRTCVCASVDFKCVILADVKYSAQKYFDTFG